jgi:acetyltransferase
MTAAKITGSALRIRHIRAPEDGLIDALVAVFTRVVGGGASMGFLAPLQREVALHYWQQVFASLGPSFHLWIAEECGDVVGSVQLSVCTKPNAPHRADVQKLFVDDRCRGRGVSRRLMDEVEDFAASIGCRLLVLDTEVGSAAEAVYRQLGWTKAGEIPDYALTPDGRLHATAYHYKLIGG